MTIGGGVISDLFPVQQRGLANSMYILGPLFGPVVGPLIGGFIAQRAGWRWVFWVLLIACGSLTAGNIIMGHETNPIVITRHKTDRMKKDLGREDLISAYDVGKDLTMIVKRTVLVRGLERPFRMLFSPILFLLGLYLSFVFGLLYLLFTTIPSVFIDSYGWAPELCGLAYLGLGIGFFSGLAVVAKTSDATIIRLAKANNGVYEPEMRLGNCTIFALFVPVGFFWYGWSADKHTHWIVPIIGLIPFSFGLMGILASIQTYYIDTGGQYAASAMAGLAFLRCILLLFCPSLAQICTQRLDWAGEILCLDSLHSD